MNENTYYGLEKGRERTVGGNYNLWLNGNFEQSNAHDFTIYDPGEFPFKNMITHFVSSSSVFKPRNAF